MNSHNTLLNDYSDLAIARRALYTIPIGIRDWDSRSDTCQCHAIYGIELGLKRILSVRKLYKMEHHIASIDGGLSPHSR